jgi:hypothetical protein
MTSKQVVDKGRSTSTAVSMLEQYADAAAEGARAALSPFLREGESMPDLGMVLKLAARYAAHNQQKLETADTAHERELADDKLPRDNRDLGGQRTRNLVGVIRGNVEANYGPSGLIALGLREPCPSTELGTQKYAHNLVGALLDPKVVLPAPISARAALDRAGFAEELAVPLAQLDEGLASVVREESEAKGTQAAKDRAMEDNDRAFSVATGLGRYTFRLCGLDALADRIRESPRRPGQLDVLDGTEEEGAG